MAVEAKGLDLRRAGAESAPALPLPRFGDPQVIDRSLASLPSRIDRKTRSLVVSAPVRSGDNAVRELARKRLRTLARALSAAGWTVTTGADFFLLALDNGQCPALMPAIREVARMLAGWTHGEGGAETPAIEITVADVPRLFARESVTWLRLPEFVADRGVVELAPVVRLGGRGSPEVPAALLDGNVALVRLPVVAVDRPEVVLWHKAEIRAFDPTTGQPTDMAGGQAGAGARVAGLADVLRMHELLDCPALRGRNDMAISIAARSLELRAMWDELLARLRRSPGQAAALKILLDFEEEADMAAIGGVVEGLRSAGCRIGLEGFGYHTGPRHAYLLAPDTICIHPFFLLGPLGFRGDVDRLVHVLGLASTFARTVVLEGVRVDKQFDFAREAVDVLRRTARSPVECAVLMQ